MSAIGEAIGKYRLLGELGRGGMGVVYRAYDPHLERRVAIKVLAAHLAQDPTTQARFLSEARAAASLQHPSIVAVYEAGENDGCSYFVMELVEGEDLAGRIEAGGPLPVSEAFPLLEKVGAALDYAHSKGLIHRDVKPANVLLGSGEPKVADFGIARIAGGTHHTQTGMLIGTPHYMAPEIWDGKEASPASDQYALGIMAYEVLVGRPPFEGESFMAIGLKHVSGPVPKISSQNVQGAVASSFGVAFGRVLAKDPAKRFGSCREFVSALAPEISKGQKRSAFAFVCIGLILLASVGMLASRRGSAGHSGPGRGPDPLDKAKGDLLVSEANLRRHKDDLRHGTFVTRNRQDLDVLQNDGGILIASNSPYQKASGYYYIAERSFFMSMDAWYHENDRIAAPKFRRELVNATNALGSCYDVSRALPMGDHRRKDVANFGGYLVERMSVFYDQNKMPLGKSDRDQLANLRSQFENL